MNKPLLLTLAAAALVLAAIAGLTRQSASAPEAAGSAPAAEPAKGSTVPFTHLIGEHCTAWVAGAPGGGSEGQSHYAHRVGGIWTVDNRVIAVAGKLDRIEGGWARFRTARDDETWVQLSAVVALQRDSELRAGASGVAVYQGPGIHVVPSEPRGDRTGHDQTGHDQIGHDHP